jgi:glycosyltransferase involved in cell wall biosynthesis
MSNYTSRARAKSNDLKNRKPIVIVCPTALGGHIEYSANLANSFSEITASKVFILSREGAKLSTAGFLHSNVEVIELLPPLTKNTYPTIARHLLKAIRLLKEIFQIALFCRSNKAALVILQEPRYGALVNLFQQRVALLFHNIPTEKIKGARQSLEVKLALSTAKNADFVIVHGKVQEVALGKQIALKGVIQVPLPGVDTWAKKINSRIKKSDAGTFLCLGEIRKTKSLELLFEAADKAELPIKIVGRKTDPAYFENLVALAARSKFCEVQEKFLSQADFDLELAQAYCLVLPYGDFQAQSHVLAKALAFGTPVIVSDLPCLREQANNNECVLFFENGNATSLGKTMEEFKSSRQSCSPFSYQWSQVASEILRVTAIKQ